MSNHSQGPRGRNRAVCHGESPQPQALGVLKEEQRLGGWAGLSGGDEKGPQGRLIGEMVKLAFPGLSCEEH